MSAGRLLTVLGLLVPLAACTQVSRLDAEPMELSASERSAVHAQVDKSREAKEWKDAWNQEVLAGADLKRLEAIAVGAAADLDGDAKDMFRELRARQWALSEDAKRTIAAAVQEKEAKKEYADAAEVLVLSADDAPAYAQAWALYSRTPPSESQDVLEEIRKAREAFERDAEARKAAEGTR